jgi:chorismate mutase
VLDRLRAEIQQLDEQLVRLLADRARIARETLAAKHAAGMPLLDPPREAAVVRRAGTLARAAGLPAEEVREIFWRVIGLCRTLQTQLGPDQDPGASKPGG